MAKKITDEKLQVSIVINGNQAQNELYKLEKDTRKLNESQKELRAEKKRLEQQGKKESVRYKEVTNLIKQNTDAINANKARMSALQKEIGLTGLTMAQLQSKATQLRIILRNLIPGSSDYKRYEAELREVNARLSELRGKAQQAKFSLSGLADGFNRYQALILSVIATLTGVVLSIQKIIDINGKLSDAQADVMKTTGMTKEEVDELTKSFGLMKTRTARIELLKLAEEGGRLGIEGVRNIQAFVNVANQLKVALGDDLSETQIREVGKMVEVYKVGEQTGRDFEASMLSLGSAINEVSASGSNQAGFLVDFLKRTAGISNQVRLSAADNIGYAATYDEIGQSAEVAATVMNKVWMDMASDSKTYAKIAGMSAKDFAELLGKDANAAMIAFLRGLNGNNEGLQVMIQKLKDIEVGGARGAQALSAIAGSVNKLEARQKTANEALWEATSLTDEYNTKNENLAATLEKVNKTVTGWFSSESIANFLGDALMWFAKLIGATEDLDGSGKRWRNTLFGIVKVITVLITSLISYRTAAALIVVMQNGLAGSTVLFNIALKAQNLWLTLSKTALVAYAGVMNFFGITTTRTTAAIARMNAVTALSPWGAFAALVMAVVGAMYLFNESTEKAITSTKVLADVQGDVNRKLEAEKDHLNNLLAIARDEAQSKENRLKAIKEINEISPEYLGNITLENINTVETTASVYKYLDALNKKIKLQLIENEIQEANQRLRDNEKKDLKEFSKWYEGWFFRGFSQIGDQFGEAFDSAAEKRKQKVIESEKQLIKELNEEWRKVFGGDDNPVPPLLRPLPSQNTDPNGPSEEELKKMEAARKKREAEFKKLVEDLKKQKEELLGIEDEAENERLARLEDGYEKERAILQSNHDRKIRDLRAQLIDEEDIRKALEKSENANLSSKERAFWLEQKEVWERKNQAINQRIAHSEYILGFNLATIQEKFFTKAIKEIEAHYNREKQIRETEFYKEISTIQSLEEAKSKLSAFLSQKELRKINDLEQAKSELKRIHQEAELKQQEEFLLQQIEQMERVVNGQKNTLGIDFNLLSPEQKDKILSDLETVRLAYAKLLAEKNKSGKSKIETTAFSISTAFGDTDILGFTANQWNTTFSNLDLLSQKLQATSMIVGGLQNIWSQYNAYVTANENASLRNYEANLERRRAQLKRQLDSGYISQVEYRNSVNKLEDDISRNRAELEYKQAKRQRDMALADAIVNTARGVTAALGMLPPMSFIFAKLTAAMGALQIATIKKTPLPARGYEEGLYPDYIKREQDGKLFKARYGGKTRSGLVTKPTYFLAGENNKPEMIIDNAAYKRLDPELRNALIRELRGIKGFENGYYSSETQRIEIPRGPQPEPSDFPPELIAKFIMTMNRMNDVLESIEERGIQAYMDSNDYRSIRKLRDATKKLEKVEQKAKLS